MFLLLVGRVCAMCGWVCKSMQTVPIWCWWHLNFLDIGLTSSVVCQVTGNPDKGRFSREDGTKRKQITGRGAFGKLHLKTPQWYRRSEGNGCLCGWVVTSVACRGGQGVGLAAGWSDCSSVLHAGGGGHLFFTSLGPPHSVSWFWNSSNSSCDVKENHLKHTFLHLVTCQQNKVEKDLETIQIGK